MIQHRFGLCQNSIEKFASHLFNKNESNFKLVNPDIINFSIDEIQGSAY